MQVEEVESAAASQAAPAARPARRAAAVKKVYVEDLSSNEESEAEDAGSEFAVSD
jgi:hypothetical protein